MAKSLQQLIEKHSFKIIFFIILINIALGFKTRGGIILLANVFYGSSTILIGTITLIEFKKGIISSHKNYFLIMFLILFLLSFFFSRNQGYGISELILFTSSSLLFLHIANNKLKQSQQKTLINSLIIAGVIAVIAGFYIYINCPYDRFSSFFYNFEDKFIGYPNALADFLLILFPLTLIKNNKYKLLATTLFASALYLTFSRGAYLSFIIELTLLGWIHRKRILNWKTINTCLIIILVAISLVHSTNTARNTKFKTIDIEEKVTLKADEKQSSVNERLEFFKGSLSIIADYPIFGIGSDGFQFVYPRYERIPFTSSNHPHNLFLKIASENGIFTSAALLVFFISIIWAGIRKKETQLITIGLIGILAHNLIDYNLNFVPNIMLLFVLAGIIAKRTESGTKKKNNFMPVLIITLSILICCLSIHDGYFNYVFQQGRSALNEKNYSNAFTLLEKARALKFPRRLYSSLGESAEEIGDSDLAKSYYKKSTEINKDDAHAYNLFGDYETAVKKDPNNFLKFHYDLIIEDNNISYEEITTYTKKLKEFIPILRNNQHNIILTDNPKYAIKIAKLIKNYEISKELTEIKKTEEEKFTKKFGFDFSYL